MESLYILPFDHRSSFIKMIYGDQNKITAEEHAKLVDLKNIIWEGFKLALDQTDLLSKAAILVDEEFGSVIHQEAAQIGVMHALSTEKSGEKIFNFENVDWAKHIDSIKPTFVKALIRVNPANDNSIQNQRLKTLSDWCKINGYQFLLEPLVEASSEDLAKVNNEKIRFDAEMRTSLFIQSIKDMHQDGVFPDIWKIEGTETVEEMKNIKMEIGNAKIIILGRGESKDKVADWLKLSAKAEGVIGFAVGRTVFAEPLLQFKNQQISRLEATKKIAENYLYFVRLFEAARKSV